MAIFSDTFTVGSDTALASHAPDTGTSWTRIWSTGPSDGYTVVAATDIAVQVDSASSGAIYTADTTYSSADYYAQCTLVDLASGGADDPIYIFVRLQDQENMYAVRLIQSGNTQSQLYKKVSGTWTALGSLFAAPADGSIVKLEIIGTALKCYDDGVEVASATDSDISLAGKAGIGSGGGTELVVSTNDGNGISNKIDNFSVDVIASGTPQASNALMMGVNF